jgi:catechol 2,3-dioxygenase-like lactoylglutathione lyase family enzyme
MEQLINTLINRYEKGTLSRRELVGTLALLSIAGGTAAAELENVSLNHVSIVVANLQRSVDFYRKTFSLPIQTEDRANKLVQLKLGRSHISIHERAGATGAVDHFAIGVDRFNRETVTAELARRGATARDGDGAGLHVVDPDGVLVQVIGNNA